jgi:hypothetical protein
MRKARSSRCYFQEFAGQRVSLMDVFGRAAKLHGALSVEIIGVPYGSRTRVAAVKGKRAVVIQGNSAAWIALYRTSRTHGYAYWTLNGRARSAGFPNPLTTDFKFGQMVLTISYVTIPSLTYRRFSRQSRLRQTLYQHRPPLIFPSSTEYLVAHMKILLAHISTYAGARGNMNRHPGKNISILPFQKLQPPRNFERFKFLPIPFRA